MPVHFRIASLLQLFFISLLFAGCAENNNNTPRGQNLPAKLSDSTPLAAPNPYATVDVSPMDIAYLPPDYTLKKMSGTAPPSPIARVIYSRPHRQGRSIFGGLLKYGEPWRLGANEATELELFQQVTIQDHKVAKGRYVLYCIPHESHWTIVFNNNLFSWGLRPDSSQDIFSVDVPVTKSDLTLEYFTMAFEQNGGNWDLLIAWENMVARLPIHL